MRPRLVLTVSAVLFACSGAAVDASYRSPPGDLPPAWSADGRSVAYVSYRSPSGLQMLDLGTGLNRLSDVSPLEAGDAWLSPDWQQLATIESAGASSPPRLVV